MNREEVKKIGLGRYFPIDPLFGAVLEDDLSKVTQLLANGSDINCVSSMDRIGLLPLVKSRPMFDLLVAHGIQVDDDIFIECITHSHGAAVVYQGYNEPANSHQFGYASGAGAVIIEWLLELGIAVNGQKRKRWDQIKTPLMEAVSWGNVDVVQVILEHNANVHTQFAPYNWQAIHFAVDEFARATKEYRSGDFNGSQKNRQRIVEMLIKSGADVNAQTAAGDTPLMWAVLRGSPYSIQFLVEQGADLLNVDKLGRDAIAWAMSSQRGRSGKNKLHQMLTLLKDQYYFTDENTGEILRREQVV